MQKNSLDMITWISWVTFGADLPTIMTCFIHITQRQTLNYLRVQPEEIKGIYENEL
jgi:hypothetical protein